MKLIQLELNKEYYGKHKDKPSLYWFNNYYTAGKSSLFSSATEHGKQICVDGEKFIVTRIDKNTVLLFFPHLGITIKEKYQFMNDFLNVYPQYKNVCDMWNQLNDQD